MKAGSETKCSELGVKAARAEHWAKGGAGAESLAKLTVEAAEQKSTFKLLFFFASFQSLRV
jgi:formyltetrahydrofolate synthetase